MTHVLDQTHHELPREDGSISEPIDEPVDESIDEYVYRILSRADWESAQHLGVILMSDLDQRDGFIHLSTKRAALETANLYFKPVDEPLVLAFSVVALGKNLRWEAVESRGGQRFPHLYASELSLSSALHIIRLEMSSQRFVWGAIEHVNRG